MEQATSSSAILKLYNKWVEKSQQEVASPREETTATEKKGGILKNLKSAIHKPSKEHTVRNVELLYLQACVQEYFVIIVLL